MKVLLETHNHDYLKLNVDFLSIVNCLGESKTSLVEFKFDSFNWEFEWSPLVSKEMNGVQAELKLA